MKLGNRPPVAEVANEADVTGTPAQYAQVATEHGTVGWDGDAEHTDIGKTTNDGNTLIKVQLFRGRDPNEPLKEGIAQGHKIWARIGGPMWYCPPKGAQCFVLFPGGYEDTPGVGLLVPAYPGPSPSIQFSKNRAVLDFGPNVDVIIKGKSVVLSDYTSPTPYYFAVGPTTGIKCGAPDASGFCLLNGQWLIYTASGGNATGGLKLTSNEVSLMLNDGQTQGLTMSGGTVTIMGTTFSAKVAIGYLGKIPTAATAVAYSVAGVATPSTSWFVSPT